MLVKDLIAQLQLVDPELTVKILDIDYMGFDPDILVVDSKHKMLTIADTEYFHCDRDEVIVYTHPTE